MQEVAATASTRTPSGTCIIIIKVLYYFIVLQKRNILNTFLRLFTRAPSGTWALWDRAASSSRGKACERGGGRAGWGRVRGRGVGERQPGERDAHSEFER